MPLRSPPRSTTPTLAYWRDEIEPLVRGNPLVEFVGEIGEREKADVPRRRPALLFPIDWPEPFGLVMIEAMACGTPVIAFPCGSVPEVIDHGVTGFLVDTIEEADCRRRARRARSTGRGCAPLRAALLHRADGRRTTSRSTSRCAAKAGRSARPETCR